MRGGPFLGLAIGVAAVSSAAIMIRLCQAPPLAIAAWRLDIAAVGCLLVVAATRTRLRFEPRQLKLGALAGAFLGLHFAAWISSLFYTTVASAVVLVATNPIFVALGSMFILREKVGTRLWLGILLSIVGSLLVGMTGVPPSAQAPNPLLGNCLALAGAVFGSAYMLIGRRVRAQVDNLSYVTLVFGGAAILLTILAFATGSKMHGFSPETWLWLVLLAAIPQGIGHTLINWSLRFLSPAQVALGILGEPVLAAVLAYFALDESISPLQAVGAVLILAGVAATIRGEPEEVDADAL